MDDRTQSEKFKKAARELECDNSSRRFKERVRKLVKHIGQTSPQRAQRLMSRIHQTQA